MSRIEGGSQSEQQPQLQPAFQFLEGEVGNDKAIQLVDDVVNGVATTLGLEAKPLSDGNLLSLRKDKIDPLPYGVRDKLAVAIKKQLLEIFRTPVTPELLARPLESLPPPSPSFDLFEKNNGRDFNAEYKNTRKNWHTILAQLTNEARYKTIADVLTICFADGPKYTLALNEILDEQTADYLRNAFEQMGIFKVVPFVQTDF